jgi:hypothetical protein
MFLSYLFQRRSEFREALKKSTDELAAKELDAQRKDAEKKRHARDTSNTIDKYCVKKPREENRKDNAEEEEEEGDEDTDMV